MTELSPDSRVRPLRVLVKGNVATRTTILAQKIDPDDRELPDVFVLKISDMYHRRPGREISVLDRLNRKTQRVPRIFGFFKGFFVCVSSSKTDEQKWIFRPSDSFVTFAMEYAPMGDALHLAQRSPKLERTQIASRMASHVLEAVACMHADLQSVHADVKLENILVSSPDRFMLADFETARFPEETRTAAKGATVFGTAFASPPEIVCPEIVDRQDRRGVLLPSADIYALGVAVFELIAGFTFVVCLKGATRAGLKDREACEDMERLTKVMRDAFCVREREFVLADFFERCVGDDLASDFIRLCTSAQPDRRPTAHQLLRHSFVRELRGDDMC